MQCLTVCVFCVFYSFQIITQYVYELLEKKCNMTKAILPVSTRSEKRHFPLWFMPLKIKGSIKYENWRKCLGFRVWLWYWVSCLKNKEKGIVRSQLSSFSASLCLSPSISLSFSLTLSLSFTPPQPTSFVQKCLLNKLTVLWRVISKARWRSMPMLNLFCIHLRWRGLSTLPSRSYSSPGSSGLRARSWSLLFVVGGMFVSFCPTLPLHSCPFSVYKSCDHFSGGVSGDVRQRWCLEAYQS